MSVRISEKEPYTLSLDSLDMQYIHSNMNYLEHSKMTDIKPIWCRNSEENNYYEFQIVSESDDCNYGSLDDIQLQLCHICNINVPVMYIKEHRASSNHKNMQTFSKKVLERVASSIIVCTDTIQNIRKDVYYCTSCSMVVLKSDEADHNLSKNHLVSLKYNELMKQYLDLYVNGITSSLMNDLYSANQENDNVKFHGNPKLNVSKEDYNEIKNEFDVIANKLKTTNYKLPDNVRNALINLREKLIARNKIVKKEETNAEFVMKTDKPAEIVTKKGENTEPDIDNYKNLSQNVELLTENVTNVVFVSGEYKKLDIVTNKNDNGTGKKVDPKTDKDIFNVEFENLKNIDFVPDARTSVEMLSKTNEIQGNTECTIKKYNCDGKSPGMGTNFDVFKPIPLDNGDSCLVLYSDGNDKIKIPINNYHSFLVNETKYHCMLCDGNDEETAQDHIKTDRHIKNVLKPINKHLMRQANGTYSHCVICNVMTRSADSHFIENKTHERFLKSYTINPTAKSSYKYCDTCDREVNINDIYHETSVEHALSALKISDTNKNAMSDSTKRNVIRSDTSDNTTPATASTNESDSKKNVISDVITADRTLPEMYCVICNVNVPNTAQTIKEHTASSIHGTNLIKFMKENRIKMTGDRYHCELCDIITKNLMRHVNYSTHKEKYSKYKSVNAQTKLEVSKNQPHTSQNTNMPTKTPSDTKKSKIDLTKQSDKLKNIKIFEHNYCNVCRVKVSCNSRLTHEVGVRHTTELSNLLGKDVSRDYNFSDEQNIEIRNARTEFMVLNNTGKQLQCRICGSAICNRDTHIYEHISGYRHKENYKLYLRKQIVTHIVPNCNI